MKLKTGILFIVLALILPGCIGCTLKAAVKGKKTLAGGIIRLGVEFPALSHALLNERSQKDVYVFIPPSYNSGAKSYPVLYYLHSHSADPAEMMRFTREVKEAMEAGEAKELIIVGVNGYNSLGGSFYVNSTATGNYEEAIIQGLIPLIDREFRTIPKKEARAISGFSMGGYGALNLALRHPDTFTAVYALGPGLFDENGLKNAMLTWNLSFKQSYGAAFSPDSTLPAPFASIPRFDGSEQDNRIVRNWEKGFGDWANKLADYQKLNVPLKGIRIDYGVNDGYRWIPQGCVYLSQLLKNAGIEHVLFEFNGGHNISAPIVLNQLLPFVTSVLEFNP